MSSIKGLMVTTDGKVQNYTQESTYGFKPMYRMMGCSMVERLPLGNRVFLWLDEDGMYNQKKVNYALSGLVLDMTGDMHRIHGTGVILAEAEDGELAGLDAQQRETVRAWLIEEDEDEEEEGE